MRSKPGDDRIPLRPLDYYFMTSRDGDKTLLDTVAGWVRTGQSFNVLVTEDSRPARHLALLLRSGGAQWPRGSHFYTLVETENAARQPQPEQPAGPRLPYNEGVDSMPSRHWWRALAVPALPALPRVPTVPRQRELS